MWISTWIVHISLTLFSHSEEFSISMQNSFAWFYKHTIHRTRANAIRRQPLFWFYFRVELFQFKVLLWKCRPIFATCYRLWYACLTSFVWLTLALLNKKKKYRSLMIIEPKFSENCENRYKLNTIQNKNNTHTTRDILCLFPFYL